MTLKCHLVEHTSMPGDGLSAKTVALTACLDEDSTFDSHGSFAAALKRIDVKISEAPDDTHLVVICTHGLEDTGTWLHMDDQLKDQRPEQLPHDLLPKSRGSVVIYAAVCWGGYPGVIRRFQHGTKPWPTFIGALAPLTATEGNELQDDLIGSLQAGLNEGALASVVSTFNDKYLDEYGHPAARISSSAGQMEPRQGTAGIAWSLLRDEDDNPLDGPFQITQVHTNANRVHVVCDKVVAVMPLGRLTLAKGTPVLIGDLFRFKSKRSPCGRYLQVVGTVQLVPTTPKP